MNKIRKYLGIALGIALMGSALPVFAYTECTVKLLRIYSGDEGYIWFHYTNGGSSFLLPADADSKNSFAMGITALTTGKYLQVRYSADGVACTTWGRNDLIGVYLLSE